MEFDELIQACIKYSEITSRRVTYEYALIKDVNDAKEHAKILADRLKGTLCHVNLIPVNTVEGTNFDKSSKQRIKNLSMFWKSQDSCYCKAGIGK